MKFNSDKTKYAILSFIMVIFMAGVGCKTAKSISGTLTFVRGDVKIMKESSTGAASQITAKIGQRVSKGDIIATGKNSFAILQFDDDSSMMEIQSEARVILQEYSEKIKDVYIEKGNVWTVVDKLSGKSQFTLRTPTSVAGVRGTKFYTFSFGDIYGTCFCHGKVQYNTTTSDYNQENSEDYVIFTRGDTTITITQKEIKEAGIEDSSHSHSVIGDSPLGKQYSLNAEEEKIFFGLVEKKLAEGH
ncbi:MAG: FecR family protein [Leptospirales bacterium]